MENEEIMRRIKIHSAMFDKYEDLIEDKGIVLLARRYMELFFYELIKHNIINESSKPKL